MACRILTTIPTYNGEAFLHKVLESLARQTVKPDRVLVLDDSSSDRTEQIVREFKEVSCEWTPSSDRLGLFGYRRTQLMVLLTVPASFPALFGSE